MVAGILIASALVWGFDDPLFEDQWNVRNTGQVIWRDVGELARQEVVGRFGADVNWSSLAGFSIPAERQVVVAVLDSGVDASHPELIGRLLPGYNALLDNDDITDDSGHGTHVAGIIAARANNGQGIVGLVDERIKILPVKVVGKEVDRRSFAFKGKIITDYIARGVHYALDQGADVINISLGWPVLVENDNIRQALARAHRQGVAVVAAAGNNNKQIPVHPCSSKEVICVGAVGIDGRLSEFSNFGGKVDILAPGEQIISTFPLGADSPILRIRGYERRNGTSQAAPAVAGVAASLKLIDPGMTPDEIKARLYSTARPVSLAGKEGKFSRHGLIDMAAALTARPQSFLEVDYKGILEVPFDETDGTFSLTLPLRSLVSDEPKVDFHVSADNPGLVIDNPRGTLGLSKGKSRAVRITGRVVDGTVDSRALLRVRLSLESGVSFVSQGAIFLARKLGSKGVVLPGAKAAEVFKEREGKLLAALKPVADRERWKEQSSYFIFSEGAITLWEASKVGFVRRRISLPGVDRVGAIFRSDLDFDGHPDLFVYGLDQEKRQVFVYLREDGSPLIPCTPGGRVVFPEGAAFRFLPLKRRYRENFPWLRQRTPCGDFKVPVIHRKHTLPAEDDSDDLIEQVGEGKKGIYNYVLSLVSQAGGLEVKLRVLDSAKLMRRLRREYNLLPIDPIVMSHPMAQSVADARAGRIGGMVSLGIGLDARRLLWRLDEYQGPLKTQAMGPGDLYGYKVIPLFVPGGDFSGKNALVSPERANALGVHLIDQRAGFVTDSWGDIVFDVLAGFVQDKQATLFVEGRYHVYAFDPHSTWRAKLPINRDSSLPGSALTETIAAVYARDFGGTFLPGLQVDSTLVYGRRLYVMLRQGERFFRPLALSILVPRECLPLPSGRDKTVLAHSLLCKDGDKVRLVSVPLVLDSL